MPLSYLSFTKQERRENVKKYEDVGRLVRRRMVMVCGTILVMVLLAVVDEHDDVDDNDKNGNG